MKLCDLRNNCFHIWSKAEHKHYGLRREAEIQQPWLEDFSELCSLPGVSWCSSIPFSYTSPIPPVSCPHWLVPVNPDVAGSLSFWVEVLVYLLCCLCTAAVFYVMERGSSFLGDLIPFVCSSNIIDIFFLQNIWLGTSHAVCVGLNLGTSKKKYFPLKSTVYRKWYHILWLRNGEYSLWRFAR